MAIVFIIAAAVGIFFLLFFIVRSILFGGWLARQFRRCNVVVDGKKGKGKDLLFQYVINKRKKPYYSNIDYGGRYENLPLVDISVAPNTFEDFIDGHVVEVPRRFEEKKDVYVSDGGIYFPSYADSVLHRVYRSLPLYYPISRHTADHNVHVNVQNLERLWKPIREQADFFVHVKERLKLPFFILVHVNTYDKYRSALECLEPMRTRFLNGFSKATADEFKALHGEIKSGWLIIRKGSIKYDTRALEKVVYGNQPRING